MAKKIYILGSNGFIGKHIQEKFSQNVSCVTVGYDKDRCDLLSYNSIRDALSDLTKDDIIVMVSSITRLTDNSYDSMIKNIDMAQNLSSFIADHPISQLIFLSTVDVYGILSDNAMINEGLIPNPGDYYSISKLTSEYIFKKTLSEKNIPLAILRLSGVYGPGDNGKSTIGILTDSARTHNKIIIYDDGNDKRDFVYVDDLFNVIDSCITKKINAIINIATGESYTIKEITNMIIKVLDKDINIEFVPKIKTQKRIKSMVYDTRLLNTLLPNLRMTSLKNGIQFYCANAHKVLNR